MSYVEKIVGQFEIEIPVDFSSNLFDEAYLLITNLRLIIIYSYQSNNHENKFIGRDLSAIKCVVFSSKINDSVIVFNNNIVPKEILIRSIE